MDNPEFKAKNQPPLDQSFTKGRFKGKVAVVVGGASGIGFAVAERFANDGAAVAIVDFHKTNGENAVQYLKSEGYDKIGYHFVNIEDKAMCVAAADAIAKENDGVIDCLVNSAVYFGTEGIKGEYADWRKTLDVNVYGAVAMVQACHPYLKKAKEGGSIVNFSSISAERAQPIRWTYSASKGAIKTMTQNMALDLAKDRIRVNSVTPGWIWSPQMAKAGSLESMLPAVEKFTMCKKTGQTSEVASVVAFLCSRDSSYVTGTNVAVDGGYCAIGPERHGDDSVFAK